ncbi:hypothetical protein K450DRAFT_225732 [Umbelopsis ramanniana AG]|uniref:Uncharacterized protein n=1 Tax=Umbelopsis ramanniana AG TaxID=1314678 RepID=A0AAD5EGH4_UMBRA|nr:uncharacterized protein K450DRAFT_225732 [Umbelopsis ramanniana AG]KAI8582982.1 hypothetical protein K450DRAFT_225732 [Umbelopsis ramanniana AG]
MGCQQGAVDSHLFNAARSRHWCGDSNNVERLVFCIISFFRSMVYCLLLFFIIANMSSIQNFRFSYYKISMYHNPGRHNEMQGTWKKFYCQLAAMSTLLMLRTAQVTQPLFILSWMKRPQFELK